MTILQEARARRRHRGSHPGRRRARRVLSVLVLTAAALLVVMVARATGPSITVQPAAVPAKPKLPAPPKPPARGSDGTAAATARGSYGTAAAPARGSYGIAAAPAAERVTVKLKGPLRSGLLFDVSSGQVLWERNPTQVMAIASLTKMMTALLVVEHAKPDSQVMITSDALHYSGSGIGLLRKGKQVSLTTLLYGLLLPSGNDAAIALADYVSGSQSRFIGLMNERAGGLALHCTHFTTVSGIVDQGNHSCAQDLALLAHTLLEQPLLARIVSSRSAILPFPVKGGKLYLYNNNPLLFLRYPGADGVKTGFTDAAGQCLVATARRGKTWLGVVLLHSNDTSTQAQQLLGAGFAKTHQT